MVSSGDIRKAIGFVAVSGAGWCVDIGLLLALGGGLLPVWAASVFSSCCGALVTFLLASRGVFKPNGGSMALKSVVLLAFNASMILLSSLALGRLAAAIAGLAVAAALPHGAPLVAAKVLVTPFSLALNFLAVRFLLERFGATVPPRNSRGHVSP